MGVRPPKALWVLAGLGGLLVGCEKPLPIQVHASGCAAWHQRRCELSADRSLRLWVDVSADASLAVSSEDGAPLSVSEAKVEGGRLLSLVVPEGITGLKVAAEHRGLEGVWRLRLSPSARSAVLERVRALQKQGTLAEASEVMGRAIPSLQGAERARALGAWARNELRRGKSDEASALFRQAIAAHEREGRFSEASDDAFALAYCLVQYGQHFAEARQVLERAEPLVADYPDGRARLPYYLGLLAAKTGDLRSALEHFRTAASRADRLGLARLSGNVRQELAELYRRFGRWSEAREQLAAVERQLDASASPCDRADLLTNVAWIELSAHESARADPTAGRSPTALLEQALGVSGCPDPNRKANILVNLALAALQEGRPELARARLAEAKALQRSPPAQVALWWLEIEGRALLLEREWAKALAVYQRLELLAATAALPEARWRAALGQARAHEQAGSTEAAIAAYAEAEGVLGQWPLSVPLAEGRDTFLGEHEQSARERVELLLRLQRTSEALSAAREARARLLVTMEREDRLARFTPSERARWEDAIGAFRREREALDREAADDWKLSAERLEEAARARRSREARLAAALDRAFTLLAGAQPARRAEARPPAPDELVLAFHPLRRGWVAFAADRDGVQAERLDRLEASDALLASFERKLAGARRIRVLAYGALRSVDFHALRWRGQPLLGHAPVEYSLDLPRRTTAPSRAEAILVVADPKGDLPAAAAEGRAVASLLEKRGLLRLLEGAAATRAQVLAGLREAGLFHYAGHGRFAGSGGWGSALPLAAGGELGVGDILALPAVPSRVVLSGCETAKVGQEAEVEGLGLGHAFLLAGSDTVIAATRPVSDHLAAELSSALHRAGAEVDPAEALRRAQLELARRAPSADWSAFRVLVP